MKKVYCKDCRYYLPLIFCESKLQKEPAFWAAPNHYEYNHSFCSTKNKNNDCSEYKRKWWKFWVKEQK